MMKGQIEDALELKEQALDMRAQDPRGALAMADEAIALLERLWEQRGKAIDAAGADAGPDERELVAALAETHGVKGGILRSDDRPAEAAAAYDEGLRFEQHPARKVDNSYNLIQRLTNRVLAEPASAGALPVWEVGDIDMWEGLENARRELRRQLATSRGNDPWAAADMITVQLLLSPRERSQGEGQVGKAYEEFEKLKPEPYVYESTLRALKDLRRGLEQVPEGGRSESWNTIVGRLDAVTGRLAEGFKVAKTW